MSVFQKFFKKLLLAVFAPKQKGALRIIGVIYDDQGKNFDSMPLGSYCVVFTGDAESDQFCLLNRYDRNQKKFIDPWIFFYVSRCNLPNSVSQASIVELTSSSDRSREFRLPVSLPSHLS